MSAFGFFSRYALLLAVTAFGVVGCSHPLSQKLEGRWFGQRVEQFDSKDIAVATGWVRGTSFEFSGDSVTVTIPAEAPRTGRYRVESAHEGQVVLAIVDEDEARHRARFTLDDEHLMRWHLDDRRAVVLRRED